MRVKLTDRFLKSVEPPASGMLKLWDTELAGFICRISPNGTKTFLVDYRTGRLRRQVKIGRFPAWSVLSARKRGQELTVLVDQGKDRAAMREADRKAPLISDLYDALLPIYEAKAKRTCADRAQMWQKTILPALGRMRVDAIEVADIEALHRTKTKLNHPYAANRIVEVLRHAFNKAIQWKMRSDNPAMHIEKNPETPRERYLGIQEYGAFLSALDQIENQQSANALRLLALTGARLSEVLNASWDQFDLENAVWVKPAATTKQRRLHRTVLSSDALDILFTMHQEHSSPHLFPGSGAGGVQREVRKSFAAACAVAEITELRIHDLRHSFASLLISSGSDLATVGKMLGHTQAQTTARYAHLHDSVQREAVLRASAALGRDRGSMSR